VSERGQISIAACGLLLALALGGALIATLGQIDRAGAAGQRAADQAALAAAHTLAGDPGTPRSALADTARASAAANGARLVSLRLLERNGYPTGVQVTVETSDGGHDPVRAAAGAEVVFSAQLAESSFRPVDLAGLGGRGAVVAAAAAQVGWPYVWGGESRAEGGFDCSGLVDFAFSAAGAPLPGRPTAAGLWQMSQQITPDRLLPGDLVFAGAASGAPHHVGIYAGGGAVLAAPHTGASVGYTPLAGGGWDGFGRLLADGDADGAVSAIDYAARRHQVPSHVLRAELEMGFSTDADTSAAALAAAESRHPDSLANALSDQLGDASIAALVLAQASGPGLALSAQVRLRSLSAAQPSAASTGPVPVADPLAGATAPVDGRHPRSSVTPLDRLGTVLRAGETVAEQLNVRGRAMPLQAVAGIRNLARFGLSGVGALLPDPDWRDASNLAGSAWDAASSAREMGSAAGTTGVEISGVGLWAARFSLLGGALSTGMFAAQAYTAQRTRDRVAYGLMAAGSAATTAGLLTGGGSLLALGAATTVVPPVGLALLAAGATLCVAGYLVRHPEWCRTALDVGGRVLDAAWKVQTAPVRVASTVATKVTDGAKAVLDEIPTPW
jgi:cell wall-associated NlpC family hydrolase